MNLNPITIVPYQEQDHEEVCKLIVDSFQGKFHSLVNLNDHDISKLLAGIWKDDASKQVVAKENGEVVGTLSLKWKGTRSSDRTTDQIHFAELFRQFGYLNVCKFIVGLQFLNYKPREYECYIEHLAVRSTHRSKGIGRQLLQWAQLFANCHTEFTHLSLHVSNKNKRAVNLYKQMAFDIEKSSYNGVRHLIFKEPVWHYMTQRTMSGIHDE
ncbi:GNAT family N-acetyltransferase [Paenibacillus marinisediminis]